MCSAFVLVAHCECFKSRVIFYLVLFVWLIGGGIGLQAETIDDVDEWKVALERALAAAPNAALVVGHNGIFRNDSIDAIEGSTEQGIFVGSRGSDN